MIILLGPDSVGKSYLASELSRLSGEPVYHFSWKDSYLDYLRPLARLRFYRAILDRFFFCEYPYARSLGRRFQFSLKQWHNLILLTFAQNPVIVLLTRIRGDSYDDSILPRDKWEACLRYYKEMLNELGYTYLVDETDHATLLNLEQEQIHLSHWWVRQWFRGYGGVGSLDPKVVLLAETLSPLNVNLIPFEAGPSGRYLSECLEGLPLGQIFITNWIKTGSETEDAKLFKQELDYLRPNKVVLLGSTAARARPILRQYEIDYDQLKHPSYIARFHRERMEEYKNELREAILDGIKG